MSAFPEVTWQPPSALPLFGEMVGGILDEVLEFQATLEEGYGRLLSFDAPNLSTTRKIEMDCRARGHGKQAGGLPYANGGYFEGVECLLKVNLF